MEAVRSEQHRGGMHMQQKREVLLQRTLLLPLMPLQLGRHMKLRPPPTAPCPTVPTSHTWPRSRLLSNLRPSGKVPAAWEHRKLLAPRLRQPRDCGTTWHASAAACMAVRLVPCTQYRGGPVLLRRNLVNTGRPAVAAAGTPGPHPCSARSCSGDNKEGW